MNILLEKNTLRKRIGTQKGEVVACTTELLNDAYLQEVMALHDFVVNAMEPSLIEPFPPDFMKEHFNRRGRILGVITDGRLVAFRAIYYPKRDEKVWNLGKDIDLSESELGSMANLQMVCVHPDYRGNGLALKMNSLALTFISKDHSRPHVCATVHPLNHWNVRILLHSGFRVKFLGQKYQGKLRFIVYQDLRQKDEAAIIKEKKQVSLHDFARQKSLLSEGFEGLEITKCKTAEECIITYGR